MVKRRLSDFGKNSEQGDDLGKLIGMMNNDEALEPNNKDPKELQRSIYEEMKTNSVSLVDIIQILQLNDLTHKDHPALEKDKSELTEQ